MQGFNDIFRLESISLFEHEVLGNLELKLYDEINNKYDTEIFQQ